MTRVVINGGGRFVGYAYTDTVLQNGQYILDLENDDVERLVAGGTIKPLAATIIRNRAYQDLPVVQAALGLAAGGELTVAQLSRWAQVTSQQVVSFGRQLNTIWRGELSGVNPLIIDPADPDTGPE